MDLVVESALHAFGSDVSYAVAMVQQARTIQNKRDLWATRKALRVAEKHARAQCASHIVPMCKERGPCGTGTCRFATGDLKTFRAPESVGSESRPVSSQFPSYDPERSVPSLKDHLFGV